MSQSSPPSSEPERRSSSAKEVGRAIGRGALDALAPAGRMIEVIGNHVILVARAFSWLLRPPYRIRNYLEACEYIGFGSLPIVLLVGLFTGMVTALQSVYAFRTFGLESLTGGTTALALAGELAPVLTSLMLAGRAGAGIAAELGTMRITEQIDALEAMAINPVQFLVLPRLVAGILMAPILVALFFIVGMLGAYLIAVVQQGVDHGQFMFNLSELLQPVHLSHGLIKAAIFGFVVILIGCYQGFFAKGGGRGVGIATNRAVVAGSVGVLTLDYFITEVLLVVLPPIQ